MGTTRLIIARHGNTFRPGETPTRVGARTDMPLVEEEKGRGIGRYLQQHSYCPNLVFAAPLQRTMQTAQLALAEMNLEMAVQIIDMFTEIDYGPDENQTEEMVRLRLGNGDAERGKLVIAAWDKEGIVPQGWKVNTGQIIESWRSFGDEISNHNEKLKTVLVVSSNGIIRFAPYLTGNFEAFTQQHPIKVSTGAVCVFEKKETSNHWNLVAWNEKIAPL